jgi:hypothetical protein
VPRGFEGIRGAVAEIEERRKGAGSDGSRIQWFKLNPGESATVRFLEQGDDVCWAWMHQLQPQGNQKFGDWEVCLNTNNDGTACPGCERRLPRKVRGYINLVWRDGPQFEKEEFKRDDGTTGIRFKRDSENKVIPAGRGPIQAVWNQGVNVFEELDGLDAAYKGLMTRDYRITRKGEGLNTKYQILPLDPEALTEADKEMLANKADLAPYIMPKSYEDWGKSDPTPSEGNSSSGDGGSVNPFMRTRS